MSRPPPQRREALPTCRVQQTTRIELIINLKTAKALGIEISPNAARHEEVPALKVGN
jgi:hypothetical protein